jgi:hypothetical protein
MLSRFLRSIPAFRSTTGWKFDRSGLEIQNRPTRFEPLKLSVAEQLFERLPSRLGESFLAAISWQKVYETSHVTNYDDDNGQYHFDQYLYENRRGTRKQ